MTWSTTANCRLSRNVFWPPGFFVLPSGLHCCYYHSMMSCVSNNFRWSPYDFCDGSLHSLSMTGNFRNRQWTQFHFFDEFFTRQWFQKWCWLVTSLRSCFSQSCCSNYSMKFNTICALESFSTWCLSRTASQFLQHPFCCHHHYLSVQ